MKYFMFGMLLLPSLAIGEHKPPTLSYIFKQAENKYTLPQGLISALAKVESNNNPKAFVKHDGNSRKSSYGLLQVQHSSAKQVGFHGKPKELMRPEVNVEYGAAYFKWLLDRSNNDYARALSCFNAGPNSSICKNGRYSPYVGKVLNAYLKNNE